MAELAGTERTILIASSSFDKPTWEPVAERLTSQGYDVVAYQADKVAAALIPLTVCIDNSAGLQVSYDNRDFSLAAVAAAWYRRPGMLGSPQHDKALQLTLDTERKAVQAALWQAVPGQRWLNAPERIRHASQKLTQLALAQEIGFDIPPTMVSNTWDSFSFLPENIVLKSSRGLLYENDEARILYTTPLQNTPAELPTDVLPFPGFWQANMPKHREWRITVVGNEVFDVAIDLADGAKDDWRKHQSDPSLVEFRHERFPDVPKERCLQFLGKLGLRFGAFDFIESPDGRITFLECNPNGQFGWLETALGLPIASAVARELAAIADSAGGQ